MKIVINVDYGGFGLSDEAIRLYLKKKGIGFEEKSLPTGTDFYINNKIFSNREIKRDDLTLIEVVEELRGTASGKYADLKIIEIPDDVEWQIEEYDGCEWIAEKHRTWGWGDE